jgi:hypothetical protein
LVAIHVPEDAQSVFIVGHGMTLPSDYELCEGTTLVCTPPKFDYRMAADGSENFVDYASVVLGEGLANFALRVDCTSSSKELVVRSWNALWDFHLLSLAAKRPVCSLFSITQGATESYRSANRGLIGRAFERVDAIEKENLEWARANKPSFDSLIRNSAFNAAIRCYGNAHHLPDLDVRIMLIWSGIERLLGVDAELSRRIALYSSMIIPGTKEERIGNFKQFKKLYGVRSKAVHGADTTEAALRDGYLGASDLLNRLLRRCVEIGRVPTSIELDELALSQAVN